MINLFYNIAYGTGVIPAELSRPLIATTVTAAGTTTLTVASALTQEFTGSTTQTVTNPVVTTLVAGWATTYLNNSTAGDVTLNSSGGNVIVVVSAGQSVKLVCRSVAADTTAAAWEVLGPFGAAGTINSSWTGGDAGAAFAPLIQLTEISRNLSITDPVTQAETYYDFSGKWINAQSTTLGNIDFSSTTVGFGIGLTSYTTDAVGIAAATNPFPAYTTSALYSCTTISAPKLRCMFCPTASTTTINSGTLTDLTLPELQVAYGWSLTLSGAGVFTSISMPKLEYFSGSIVTSITTPLATLNLPMLKSIGQLTIQSSAAITSINLTSLQYIQGSYSQPTSTAGLTTIPLPAVVCVGGTFVISSTAVTGAVSLPTLKYLLTNGTNQITGGSITSIAFNALAYCHNLTLSSLPSLTTVSFAGLIAHGALTFNSGNGAIVTATMGTIGTLKLVLSGSTIHLGSQSLNVASVDAILALYASLDGTNGTTAWSVGTIRLNLPTNATPSAQGIIDKATCVARGLTVLTN